MSVRGAPDSPLGRMYQDYINYMMQKDINELLHLYTEECLLISTMTNDKQPLYVQGREELEEFLKGRLFGLEDIETQVIQWAETDNILMMTEKTQIQVDGQTATYSFYNNWVLLERKISIHFAGVIAYPDGTYVDEIIPPPSSLST